MIKSLIIIKINKIKRNREIGKWNSGIFTMQIRNRQDEL